MRRSSCQIPWMQPRTWPPLDPVTDHTVNFIICAGAVLGMVSVRAIFLLCLAMAGACSMNVADPSGGRACPYSDFELHEWSAAVERAFAEEYGGILAGVTDDVLVSCKATQCLPVDGVEGCVSGHALTDSSIVLATQYAHGETIPLHYTAFTHELVHIILERMTGDADGDHEHDAFDRLDYLMRQRALRYERPDLFCM